MKGKDKEKELLAMFSDVMTICHNASKKLEKASELFESSPQNAIYFTQLNDIWQEVSRIIALTRTISNKAMD